MIAGTTTPITKYATNIGILVEASVIGAISEFNPKPPNVNGTLNPKNNVAIGAATTAAIIGGNASLGFANRLGNCTLGVMTPWAMFAPISFCRHEITVKPTNWAVVPINAAPADSGSSITATASAADEAGAIKKIDQASETHIDPSNGFTFIDSAIKALSQFKAGVVTLAKAKADN